MSTRIPAILLLSSSIMLVAVGCDPPATPPVEESDPEVIELIESDVVITTPTESTSDRASGFIVPDEQPANDAPGASGDDATGDAATDDAVEPNAAETDAATTRFKADVGVGKKGRGYGGGLISEPAKQYFSIREKTVFQIQIPNALKMYKALHGKLPKDQDTFMESIVKENNIALPELPEGKSYVYDAEEGELMVQSGGDSAAE